MASGKPPSLPMSLVATTLFLLSAFALLGTPGPGIAALLVVGKRHGFMGSLRFFAGLQGGLAIAAVVCASGLLSVLSAVPAVTWVLTLTAVIYLGWLAWSIAMSPVAAAPDTGEAVTTFTAGLLLGISNPKAYLGFVTLFASQTLISGSHAADAMFKWLLTIAVILVVDIAWLYAGARLGRVSLSPRAERCINVALGLTILVVALYSMRALVV
jgi:threonine/homoserine/homoserine lactone efflux protein